MELTFSVLQHVPACNSSTQWQSRQIACKRAFKFVHTSLLCSRWQKVSSDIIDCQYLLPFQELPIFQKGVIKWGLVGSVILLSKNTYICSVPGCTGDILLQLYCNVSPKIGAPRAAWIASTTAMLNLAIAQCTACKLSIFLIIYRNMHFSGKWCAAVCNCAKEQREKQHQKSREALHPWPKSKGRVTMENCAKALGVSA